MKDVVIVDAFRTPVGNHGGKLCDFDAVALAQIVINEAFAGQVLAVGVELDWDWKKVNVNGGAIALGHPVGSSGCRIVETLVKEMKRRNIGGVSTMYGLATLCAEGGQASALIVETPNQESNQHDHKNLPVIVHNRLNVLTNLEGGTK